jgi:hypothetical protein
LGTWFIDLVNDSFHQRSILAQRAVVQLIQVKSTQYKDNITKLFFKGIYTVDLADVKYLEKTKQ